MRGQQIRRPSGQRDGIADWLGFGVGMRELAQFAPGCRVQEPNRFVAAGDDKAMSWRTRQDFDGIVGKRVSTQASLPKEIPEVAPLEPAQVTLAWFGKVVGQQ